MPIVAIVIVLLFLVFGRRKGNDSKYIRESEVVDTKPNGKTETEKHTLWWHVGHYKLVWLQHWRRSTTLRVSAGLLAFGLGVWIFPLTREWWSSQWVSFGLYLIAALAIICLGFMLGPAQKVPFEYRLRPLLLIIGIAIAVYGLGANTKFGQSTWSWIASHFGRTDGNIGLTPEETADLPDGFVESDNPNHWSNHVTDENRDVVNMVRAAVQSELVPTHWDLAMQICGMESAWFRQFDEDGNVLRNVKNNDGSIDYGVCQINSIWMKKSKELGDGFRIDGPADENIRMAMWIWTNPETRGPREWTGTYNTALAVVRNARTTPETVNARRTPERSPAEQETVQAGIALVSQTEPIHQQRNPQREVSVTAMFPGWVTDKSSMTCDLEEDAEIEAVGEPGIFYWSDTNFSTNILKPGETASLAGFKCVAVRYFSPTFGGKLTEGQSPYAIVRRYK
ncbi:MAG: hypothetical protein WAX44_00835 [Minisyncoccia bacterium]